MNLCSESEDPHIFKCLHHYKKNHSHLLHCKVRIKKVVNLKRNREWFTTTHIFFPAVNWKIYNGDDIWKHFTYFFTEILPALSTWIQSLVWAFCRKFVAEPLSWMRLYANLISSSVQCWNEMTNRERERKEMSLIFLFLLCGLFL